MTTQELNRDIKRLSKKYNAKSRGEATKEYFDWLEKEIKPELRRLYYADSDMSDLNSNSLRILIRLNLSLRVIPFHHFGSGIELSKLN